jgi:branched-chain amino acid transport system ATP-binding protein
MQQYRDETVADLSYGARKNVELARALCASPQLLLLDEPASGLNAEETKDVSFWLKDIKEELEVTIIMVEHDMNLVGRIADRCLALDNGKVLAVGSVSEVQSSSEVQKAYLGGFGHE